MTHSLHRRGDFESLKEDFVVLGCPATGVRFSEKRSWKTNNQTLQRVRNDQAGGATI